MVVAAGTPGTRRLQLEIDERSRGSLGPHEVLEVPLSLPLRRPQPRARRNRELEAG